MVFTVDTSVTLDIILDQLTMSSAEAKKSGRSILTCKCEKYEIRDM